MSEAEAMFGYNLGRSRTDPFWDCIHLIGPAGGETTLCGHSLDDVAQALSFHGGRKPGEMSGCWTCLSESNRWARRR